MTIMANPRRYLLGGLLLLAAYLGHADTLVVDPHGGTPYATVQSAVDAAQPGDVVLVRCGTYDENVVVTTDVEIRGDDPACVAIDGGRRDVVLTLDSTGPVRVEGLTVRNGLGAIASGVLVVSGAPVVTHNVIENNGLFLPGGDPDFDASGSAGAFYLSAGTSADISRNVIRDNVGFYGGGIMMSVATPTITANLFTGNAGRFGGGIYATSSDAVLTSNTIVDNLSGYTGGIWSYSSNLELVNNAVVFNHSVWGAPSGIYAIGGSSGTTFRGNDFFGNEFGDFGVIVDPTGSDGNISADPEFLDAGGRGFADFQPRSSSPLVDAGVATVETVDLRGIPRPLDGDADGTSLPDIGAREGEGLTDLRFEGASLAWNQGRHVPELYNVYRGDLDVLRAGGTVVQDPEIVPAADHFCELGTNALLDAALPDAGEGFFYLVTALGAVEGSLGFDGALVERTRTIDCRL